MTRRPLNFLTALSLLMCVATALIWSGSIAKPRVVKLADDVAGDRSLGAGAGRVTYVGRRFDRDDDISRLLRGTTVRPDIGGASWRHGGFNLKWRVPLRVPHTGPTGSGAVTLGELTILSVPFWFIMTATGAPPAVRLLRRAGVGRRGARGGVCPACGYDIRATPERCPECGRISSVSTTG